MGDGDPDVNEFLDVLGEQTLPGSVVDLKNVENYRSFVRGFRQEYRSFTRNFQDSSARHRRVGYILSAGGYSYDWASVQHNLRTVVANLQLFLQYVEAKDLRQAYRLFGSAVAYLLRTLDLYLADSGFPLGDTHVQDIVFVEVRNISGILRKDFGYDKEFLKAFISDRLKIIRKSHPELDADHRKFLAQFAAAFMSG